jgi:class 3 adenylate cyclase/predicted ATPase
VQETGFDVKTWLRGLGLEEYCNLFVENGIDGDVIADITGDDLKAMGIVAVGHRRKLLSAIKQLGLGQTAEEKGEVERRQLTLMFCDLVGSTEAMQRIDPEEGRAVLRAFMSAIETAAAAHQGFVAKFMGDGALVYFGYPKALENNAEAAVRTGAAVVAALRGLQWPDGRPMAVRVSVATGRVVIGDLIGQGSAREVSVVGETAHLAARLQALASPGQVVIDDRTRRMLGQLVTVAPLGQKEIKGFDQPVTVWSVTGDRKARSRFIALRAGSMADLVGRDESLAALMSVCDRARAGQGAAVTIRGEPGIGKSRIAHELSDYAVASGMDVMSWFCSPAEAVTSYAPVIGHYAASLDADSEAGRRAQLAGALLPVASDPTEVMALFERLLGLTPSVDLLRDYSSPRIRRRTIEVILEQIAARAREKPLLIVIEDSHWSDPSTAELAGEIAAQARNLPLMVMTTYRDDIDDLWPDVAGISRLRLTPLGEIEGADLVRRIAGETPIDGALVESIVAKADGVPLFVEELTRAVLDGRGGGLGDVPDTLQDALAARVDRLGAGRRTIQVAALLGRDFDGAQLARVVGRDVVRVSDDLKVMEGAHIVVRPSGAPEGTYRFQHALIQDTLADGLLLVDRSELHRQIAATLIADLEKGSQLPPERVARHFELGGDILSASGWYTRAGLSAMDRFANQEALRLLDKALDLVRRALTGKALASAELGILGLMGVASTMLYGWSAPQVGEIYRRAYSGWDAAGAGAETFPTAIGLLSYSIVRGDFADAGRMAVDALRIAEAVQDKEWIMAVEHEIGALRLYQGEIAEGLKHLERCWALYDHDNHWRHMQFTGKNQGLFCLYHLGLALGTQGQATRARELTALGIRITPTTPNAFTHTITRMAHPALLTSLHDADGVLEHIDTALAIAAEQGFPHMIAQGLCMKGWALSIKGLVADGLPAMIQGVGMWRGMGAGMRLPLYLGLLAEGHLIAGNVAAGLEAADDALRVAARTGEVLQVPDALRIKAELMVLGGAPAAESEDMFRDAIRSAGEMDARIYAWRAEARLGQLLLSTGRGAEGTAMVQNAVRQFEAAGMPWDAADARVPLRRPV